MRVRNAAGFRRVGLNRCMPAARAEGSPWTLAVCLAAVLGFLWFVLFRQSAVPSYRINVPNTPPPAALLGRWVLVRPLGSSNDVPEGSLSFGNNGEIQWYDGCNGCSGYAVVDGERIEFFPFQRCSAKYCMNSEKNGLEQIPGVGAARWFLDGKHLVLETPSVDWVFMR